MTDAELAAARLAELLNAERENAALRAEVEHLRGERAAVLAYMRRAAWWDCDDCGFDGKKLMEHLELSLHRAGERR